MKSILSLFLLLVCTSMIFSQALPIADNSFLVEEAYNQEAGVVQHVNTFQRMRGGDWLYTFTQEWPIKSQKHQFSFTLPVQDSKSINTGLGDMDITYRYQLINNSNVAVSPRVSLIFPTGSVSRESGRGSVGLGFNMPVSVTHSKHFVTHWNAGTTITPRAKNISDERATTFDYSLGQSIVWLAHSRFNLLFETVWNSEETVIGPDRKDREYGLLLNPGIRWAHNFKNGLQIVPGIAVPVGVGPSRGERGLFFYISFEHPFRKID
jgi:hypothetical protein